jgi:hypothetical protein
MIKSALLAIWKFTKSNSAALIIGAAIIVGLNLPLFLSGAQSLWYEISGQAAREQEKNQQAMNQRKTMTEAWNSFLLANRGNDNPEIKVVRNTSGDFICMENWFLSSQDRKDHFADMFIRYLNQNLVLGRNDWDYEMVDNDFFQTLVRQAKIMTLNT